jgi:hypothetical protein
MYVDSDEYDGDLDDQVIGCCDCCDCIITVTDRYVDGLCGPCADDEDE